jgi:phage terminase small subunit
MARMVKQKLSPGAPDKPATLSPAAAAAWDRLVAELSASGIQVSKAHRALLSIASTLTADIADAWDVVKAEGTYLTNIKTGALQAHPAAKRLDALRRDYIKVMSLIGLRSAVHGDSSGPSLEEILNG